MADLIQIDTDEEMDKYAEAELISKNPPPVAAIKKKTLNYNPMTGRNDVLVSLSSGGYVKVGDEELPRVEQVQKYSRQLEGMPFDMADYEAAGFSAEEVQAAGVMPVEQEKTGRTEPLREGEELRLRREGEAIAAPADPTLRQNTTDTLREIFVAAGLDNFQARQIAEGLIGNPNATRDLGIGVADFTPAGLFFGAQEGYRTFERGINTGDPTTIGMGALEAGLSLLEAVPLTAAGAKAAKSSIPTLRQALVDLGQGAEARIAERGDTTLFSNPIEPAVDQALAAAGRAARVEKPTETKSGIIAFHGSGADFNEFSLEKIGTGEGNQAYGYGLYFTDTKSIAEFYKDTVAEERNFLHLNDKPLNSVYTEDNEEKFGEYVNENFAPDEINDVYSVLDNLGQGLSSIEDADAMAENSLTRSQMQIYNKIKGDLEVPEIPEGKMYEVMINLQQEDLLDYDKPLSSQPKKIQSAALEAAKSAGAYKGTDEKTLELSGGALLSDMVNNIIIKRNLQGMTSEAEKIAAQEFFNQGIPGIKYFDNASRNTADGTSLGVIETENGFVGRVESTVPSMFGPTDPQRVLTRSRPYKSKQEAEEWINEAIGRNTRNYVIFDDRLVEIMKKYGIVGPVAVSAMASQEQEEA